MLFISFSLTAMERDKEQVTLLSLPNDLKIEILVKLLSKSDSSLVPLEDAGMFLRPFLLSSRTVYFNDEFQNKLFKRMQQIYRYLFEPYIWFDIPTPTSKKNLQNTQINFANTMVRLIVDRSSFYPVQINMLRQVYPQHAAILRKKWDKHVKDYVTLSNSTPQSPVR